MRWLLLSVVCCLASCANGAGGGEDVDASDLSDALGDGAGDSRRSRARARGATGAVEIRVYGYSATGSGGTMRIEATLTVSGAVK